MRYNYEFTIRKEEKEEKDDIKPWMIDYKFFQKSIKLNLLVGTADDGLQIPANAMKSLNLKDNDIVSLSFVSTKDKKEYTVKIKVKTLSFIRNELYINGVIGFHSLSCAIEQYYPGKSLTCEWLAKNHLKLFVNNK